jgi:hypothetical protein
MSLPFFAPPFKNFTKIKSRLDNNLSIPSRDKVAHVNNLLFKRQYNPSYMGCQPALIINSSDGVDIKWRPAIFGCAVSKMPHSLVWGITGKGAAPPQGTDGAAFVPPAS